MASFARAGLASLAVAAAVLTGADLAAACSCADRDERDRLEEGEIGLLGRVLERRELHDTRHRTLDGQPLISGWEYRVRVQRGVGARFGPHATVRVPADGCEPAPTPVGRRLAAFVRKRGYGWLTHGCSMADPGEFERALRPYPRALGRGKLALLAGGRFGDARLIALDVRGRILAYGFGRGEVQQVSICPGGQVAAELVARRNDITVAARDLRTLRVVWSVDLPLRQPLYLGGATIRCADAAAGVVHAAALQRRGRAPEQTHVLGVTSAGATRIARVRGYAPHLGGRDAYLTSARRLLAVALADGEVRRLARLRYYAEPLEESPDGRWLAFADLGERLSLLNLRTGAARSVQVRNGGGIAWLSNDSFLFRRGGEGRVYDSSLKLVRRYPFFRLQHQAQVGDRLFGTSRFRLGSLDLASGRRRTVATLPDRGINALEGVTDGPSVEADRRAPAVAARAANLNHACRPSAATTGS